MNISELPLPQNWPHQVRSAMLHVVSLAHWAIIYTRSWAADSRLQRVRLAAKLNRAENEIALLREEMRIIKSRMAKIPARHRPYYPPTERMAVLELKAARGWNLAQTARAFLVEPETIAEWMRRVEDDSLVRTVEPINKFPAFVRYIVRRLKTLCPTMGKKRIAEVLARAGLHLAATTVSRFLKTSSITLPDPENDQHVEAALCRLSPRKVVTAKYPNHVWHLDLTVVPTSGGFWTSWLPFALPQVWPFCWWIGLIMDHFSRRVIGFAIFMKQPASIEIRSFIGRVIHRIGHSPKYIISDKGCQFWCSGFKKWCKRRKIRPRFGAVGKYGSIALIERYFRSMKSEYLRRILVPVDLNEMRHELSLYAAWYNQFRPNQALAGRTPMEVYQKITPANEQPRYEPRAHWPSRSPCASPQTKLKGRRGAGVELYVSYLEGRKHLPIVELNVA